MCFSSSDSILFFYQTHKIQKQVPFADKSVNAFTYFLCVPCGNYQLLLMGVSTSKKPNCKQIIRNNADNIELLNINYVCTIFVMHTFYANIYMNKTHTKNKKKNSNETSKTIRRTVLLKKTVESTKCSMLFVYRHKSQPQIL